MTDQEYKKFEASLTLLSEQITDFIEQYDKDMRGDMNSDNGGRRGVIENIRELRKSYDELDEKVKEVKEMEDKVNKNTEFRKSMQKAWWIAVKAFITVIVMAGLYALGVYLVNINP